MRNSLLSGQVGIPDGAYTLLQQSDLEQAVSFIRQNQETLERVIGEETGILPSGGGGIKNWIRFSANGTKVAGTGITVSRVSEGTYLLTASSAFPTSGGSFQYGVIALPSTVSGNGGDGVSPFQAANTFEAVVTDTADNTLFLYSPLHNKVYAWGSDSNDIWIHDIDSWTTAAVQEATGVGMGLVSPRSGCLDKDGDIIWVSGEYSADAVKAYTISTDTWTTFEIPSLGDVFHSVIGSRDGYIIVQTNGTTRAYQPNFGTPTLGAAVQDYSIVFWNSVSSILTWTEDGYGWTWFGASPSELYALSPEAAGYDTHALPYEINAAGTSVRMQQVTCPIAYDSRRNVLIVSLQDGVSTLLPGIFRYSDWKIGTDDSGKWERLSSTIAYTSIEYDPVTDIIIGVGFASGTVDRYVAQTGQLIDSVYVPDFAATYSVAAGRHSFYLNGAHYLLALKGGTEYILRIDYDGADVQLNSGNSFVSSVLICQYQIISATQAYVYGFRSVSPPILADAEITAAMVSDADTSAAVTITHPSTGAASVNAIGNGAFNIWQRGTTFVAVNSNTVTADRWRYLKSGAMVHTVSRSTDVPTSAQAGRVFDYSILVDCTTVDTSLAASDYAALVHRVEGYFWAGFAQRALMLSFWVKATLTGTYCVGLTNSGGNRSYVGEYTVNTADTWEYKTISIAGSPSAGTWDYVDGVGLGVYFPLAAGTDFQITADTWSTTSAASFATSNQVNACNSTANNFRITGVQIQAGTVATEFEHLSFADELDRALRYFEKSFQYATQPAIAAGTNGASIGVQVVGSSASQGMAIDVRWRVRKRSTSPTVVTYNTAGAGNEIRNVTRSEDCSSTSFSGTENDLQMRFACTTSGSSAAGDVLAIHWTCDAEL